MVPEELGLPARQFERTCLGFGLSGAPAEFQYETDRLVMPATTKRDDNDLGPYYSVYLVDVAIAGETVEEMTQRLDAFFNRVRAAGFLLKAKKCEIFQDTVAYLGHYLNTKGILTTRS